MASYPDFNPNNRDSATLDDFRNRAISDTFERVDGQTAGDHDCAAGIVQPDSVVDTIRSSRPSYSRCGLLSGAEPDRSCRNPAIPACPISLAMPVQHLIDTYKAFGFGEPTGLG